MIQSFTFTDAGVNCRNGIAKIRRPTLGAGNVYTTPDLRTFRRKSLKLKKVETPNLDIIFSEQVTELEFQLNWCKTKGRKNKFYRLLSDGENRGELVSLLLRKLLTIDSNKNLGYPVTKK